MKKIYTVIFFGVLFAHAVAQTEIPKAQAMFVYNFSRLIEWPASYKSGPFIIGVLGTSTTQAELETFTAGKSVGSQPISIKKFSSAEEFSNCHILFVPFSKTKELAAIIPKLQGKSTLIITEKNGAIELGSAINFVIIGDKLKFELKVENATKYEIKMSSKLGEMAFKVY